MGQMTYVRACVSDSIADLRNFSADIENNIEDIVNLTSNVSNTFLYHMSHIVTVFVLCGLTVYILDS